MEWDLFEGLAFTGGTAALGLSAIGNPGLVCVTPVALAPPVMRWLAVQSRSPMTAFVTPGDRAGRACLHYVTPGGADLNFCGHVTLLAAFALHQFGGCGARLSFDRDPAFASSADPLDAQIGHDGGWFATRAYDSAPYQPAPHAYAQIALALDLSLQSRAEMWISALGDLLILIDDPHALRALHPDRDALLALRPDGDAIIALRHPGGGGFRSCVVSSPSAVAGFDFEARVFVPMAGIDEDIACGSVNCSLAPLWARRLGQTKLRMLSCFADSAGVLQIGGLQDIDLTGAGRLRIAGGVRRLRRARFCIAGDPLCDAALRRFVQGCRPVLVRKPGPVAACSDGAVVAQGGLFA